MKKKSASKIKPKKVQVQGFQGTRFLEKKFKEPSSLKSSSSAVVEDNFKIRKIKVKIVGIGGGGASIVSEVSSLLKAYSFVACDTDIRTAKKIKKGVKFFQLGSNVLNGMGTGMNTDLAGKIANDEKDKIEQIFAGQDICVLVGCLGGGVASGAGPIFAAAAKNQKCLSIGIFTLPFIFEGEKKMKVARKAITELKEYLSGIIVVSNEKIFQLTDKKISLKKALSFLNQFFALWLAELLDVVFKPSLVNIDFADLKAILKDRGHTLFFSQAQAAGVNRVDDIIKNIFQNNLLSEPPKNVKRALFNISGGKDLKLKEVELISEEISRLNPKAKIIFGISQVSQQKEKIKVVLLAVCEDDKKLKILEEKPKEEPVKLKKKSPTPPLRLPKRRSGVGGSVVPVVVEKTRRTAIEAQKAEDEAEKIEWLTETDWDVPAFMRNNKK
ncbi:MAG: cell division protein FtsZ [bacterium]|nr:cell division protein FtsZ [bacterium]